MIFENRSTVHMWQRHFSDFVSLSLDRSDGTTACLYMCMLRRVAHQSKRRRQIAGAEPSSRGFSRSIVVVGLSVTDCGSQCSVFQMGHVRTCRPVTGWNAHRSQVFCKGKRQTACLLFLLLFPVLVVVAGDSIGNFNKYNFRRKNIRNNLRTKLFHSANLFMWRLCERHHTSPCDVHALGTKHHTSKDVMSLFQSAAYKSYSM
jgi:hypothetical protein